MDKNGTDSDPGFSSTIVSPISADQPLAFAGINRTNRSRIDQHRLLLAACALTCLVTMLPGRSIAGRGETVHRPVPEQPETASDEPAGKAGQPTPGQPLSKIRIRDPFILPDRNSQTYYLVASSGDAITVRESKDLVTWSDPRVVFTKPAGFWGSGSIWAPEMHACRGEFFLFATFMNDTPIGEQWQDWPPRVERGTQVMHADSPLGPFQPFGNTPHTPVADMALDGTMWIEEDVPYMVYCHEWVQIRDGTIELVRLTNDLSDTVGVPQLLFHASDASWTPRGRDRYVTDGPALYRSKSGKLFMLWSSFTDTGYTTGVAASDSGRVAGPWRHHPEPLFRKDGGHAMIFRAFDGALVVSLHSPNRSPDERCQLFEVEDTGDTLRIVRTR